MNIKFDTDTIRKINLFEEITGVEVLDCYINEDSAHFVVNDDKVGLAIGKGGATIKRVQDRLGKEIRVYGYSEDIEEFVNNLVPASINGVDVDENGSTTTATIKVDRNKRSRVVGRGGKNIKVVKRFLQKEFGVDEVQVE